MPTSTGVLRILRDVCYVGTLRDVRYIGVLRDVRYIDILRYVRYVGALVGLSRGSMCRTLTRGSTV